ncbi:MAG: DNA mismatch repair protein MutS [Betaproteobacteria bacterium]|nr:DNA mismatch repair protein MutS [Betaproteobacteria bacterium]
MKLHALQDLRQVQQALKAEHARAQAEAAARVAEQERREAEAQLFARAVGAVQPLADRRQARLPKTPAAPVARQFQQDEAAALRDSLSDGFDVSSLLDTDETLSFSRPGIGPDVTRKLRKGEWAIQRELDLHGLRSDQARLVLAEFIRESQRQGLRCVRVVHGKGLGSPGKTPVLKHKVHSWLVQKNQVMAFVQAKPAEGGAGALVVLLRPAA